MINNWTNIQTYIDTITETLKQNTPVNTGKLKGSVTTNVRPSKDGATIEFEMLKYGEFLDKGVNGIEVSHGSPYSFKKRPPAGAFKSYAGSIGGGFAIATSIYKKGIRPRNFIQPVIDNKIQGLADIIAEGIWEDFFNENNKNKNKI